MKKLYDLLKKIPKGKVSTYKALSKATGLNPRVVGMVLRSNPNPEKVPCYKIIRSDGTLGGYSLGKELKRKLLEKDGIKIEKDRIDLKKYGHEFHSKIDLNKKNRNGL